MKDILMTAGGEIYNVRTPIFASRVGRLESLPPVLIAGTSFDSCRICFGHAGLPYAVFYTCSQAHAH